MWRVWPCLASAEALQVSAAIATGEMLHYAVRTLQACHSQQSPVRGRSRCLLKQSDAMAAELHRTYIPAAQMGDRTSQYWGRWRHGWVAQTRSRYDPQVSQTKFSIVPNGRVWRALVKSDECGRIVVGIPNKASQSLQVGIRNLWERRSEERGAYQGIAGLSRQFVAVLHEGIA